MTKITKPMTPPSAETMVTVKVLSISFTENMDEIENVRKEKIKDLI